MTTTSTPRPTTAGTVTVPGPGCSAEVRVTRSLLGWGVLAGPFYVVLGLTQAATRDGFDLTRHPWSLLAVGQYGWIQTANMMLTGLMLVAAAIGYRRVLRTGVGARWAPRLLAAYGVALVAAGLFHADPMQGFPLGTPTVPPVQPTAHGTVHMVVGAVGFGCLVMATGLLATRFRREGRGRLAAFTAATGAALLVAFAAIASGSGAPAVTLSFTGAVVLTWVWLSVTSSRLYRTVS